MSIMDYFRTKPQSSASIAKDRLQIIVAQRNQPDYLPQLQRDLIAVISKYIAIDQDAINVSIDQSDDVAILELDIPLPEGSS